MAINRPPPSKSDIVAPIVVAGLARCGTSLLMQMLHQGGIECIGPWPSFEVSETVCRGAQAFVAGHSGKAVKVLDPHRVGLSGDVRVIWMDRDWQQQAKSHAKLVAILMGLHYDRNGMRALKASLAKDTARCMRMIGSRPLLRLRFESVLADPSGTAATLRAFLCRDDFDCGKAAAAVQSRHAACAPGLDMEMSLVSANLPDDDLRPIRHARPDAAGCGQNPRCTLGTP